MYLHFAVPTILSYLCTHVLEVKILYFDNRVNGTTSVCRTEVSMHVGILSYGNAVVRMPVDNSGIWYQDIDKEVQ